MRAGAGCGAARRGVARATRMIGFRLLVLFTAAAIAVCIAGYLLGGDRRWLRRAWLIARVAAAAALVFFAVLILERVG